MINLQDAIIALDSNIKIVHGDIAFDDNGNEISYDKSAAQAKLTELEAAETAKKELALAKLTALGLTTADLTALGIA